MPYVATYEDSPLTREQLDAMGGRVVVEFGTNWCGFCQGAQAAIKEAFGHHPEVRHIKIEDGKGKPLGRSFRVKLWPTLVFMSAGKEIGRLERPQGVEEIAAQLVQLSGDESAAQSGG